MSVLITVILIHRMTVLMSSYPGNNFIQALHLGDFSWVPGNIKPDVQLYIQLFLALSVYYAHLPDNLLMNELLPHPGVWWTIGNEDKLEILPK